MTLVLGSLLRLAGGGVCCGSGDACVVCCCVGGGGVGVVSAGAGDGWGCALGGVCGLFFCFGGAVLDCVGFGCFVAPPVVTVVCSEISSSVCVSGVVVVVVEVNAVFITGVAFIAGLVDGDIVIFGLYTHCVWSLRQSIHFVSFLPSTPSKSLATLSAKFPIPMLTKFLRSTWHLTWSAFVTLGASCCWLSLWVALASLPISTLVTHSLHGDSKPWLIHCVVDFWRCCCASSV